MHDVIQNALRWARVKGDRIHELDPKAYRTGYTALRNLFEEFVRVDDYVRCVAGATAVYGWMPTITRGVDEGAWRLSQPVLRELAQAKTWSAARQALTRRPDTIKLVNGSVVGTSKFLHFLNPHILPIWDSNIAAAFGLQRRPAVERLSAYLAYGDEVHAALAEGVEYPPEFRVFAGRSLTGVRELELLLFLYGRSIARP